MAKQQSSLRYIYKIHSSRLRKSGWSLVLPLQQAIENDEVVSLADSATLRFIREIKNKEKSNDVDFEDRTSAIRRIISSLKRLPYTAENKKKIKQSYTDLYNHLFVEDYVCIVVDKLQDFDRMNSKKSFYINGIKFKRLLATTGGAKKSTVVYVSINVYDELVEKIDNGRNKNKELVPAKLEAYKALACSASIPVPDPRGVLVVHDCETTFKSNVIKIDDTKSDYPEVTHEKDYDISLIDSDGYGLISPTLSELWTFNLEGKKETRSGFCARNSFCKGMLFTFDFHKFAKEEAKNYFVTDAWGNKIDIRGVDVVLTTSMLKLWDSYESIEHYLECCKTNGHTFSVTKVTPVALENERHLNYQFIQSLELNDLDIDKLIYPTVREIKEVLGGDWRKSLLFLNGIHQTEKTFNESDSFVKALMVEKEMINDPFVRTKINNMIRKKINAAKIGVLKVRGNFSIISGDPYSLCQSIFKQTVTGLLKSGEFYSKYWNDKTVEKVACFRAPMTCHNNIRILRLKNTDDMQEWYKYMPTVTVFNSWDTTSHALNGADRDSDSILTTDNEIIISNIQELDAIVCVQKSAKKVSVTEKDLIQSNKNSFGDEIGSTTNKITAMFDVLAKFKKGSEEYEALSYRIQCGQNYQQNAIDKTKGIQSKSLPKEWYDYKANITYDTNKITDKNEFNLSILANKKPYFFIYIYPELKKEYDKFMQNTQRNCVFTFGSTIDELRKKKVKNDKEKAYLEKFDNRMPVFTNPSVMNKICWKVESLFTKSDTEPKDRPFDSTMLKTEKSYSKGRYKAVKEIHNQYIQILQEYAIKDKNERIDADDNRNSRRIFKEDFVRKCLEVCNDHEDLANILIDMCYQNNNSKQFVWDVCGDQIVKNLLNKNNYKVSIIQRSLDGDISYCGDNFSIVETEVNIAE